MLYLVITVCLYCISLGFYDFFCKKIKVFAQRTLL